MTASDKIGACMMRFEGQSLSKIAENYNVSRQNLFTVFGRYQKRMEHELKNIKLPQQCKKKKKFVAPSKETVFKIYEAIVNHKHVDYMIDTLHILPNDIHVAASCLVGYRSSINGPYCRSIALWMCSNKITVTDLAAQFHISPNSFRSFFYGTYQMPEETIKKIKKVSGIPIRRIRSENNQSAPVLRPYHKRVPIPHPQEGDEEIAKELQDRNKSNSRAET